jgi:hypothetical protein
MRGGTFPAGELGDAAHLGLGLVLFQSALRRFSTSVMLGFAHVDEVDEIRPPGRAGEAGGRFLGRL